MDFYTKAIQNGTYTFDTPDNSYPGFRGPVFRNEKPEKDEWAMRQKDRSPRLFHRIDFLF